MARTLEEIYAQIARLPAADRLRLAARILNDLAGDSPPGANGKQAPAAPSDERRTTNDQRPTTNDQRRSPTTPPPHHLTTSPAPARFIIVDGSNVLGRLPGYELSSPASRDRLALRLQEYAHAHPHTRITLYFDGQKASSSRQGGIEVRYSPKTRPADHFILETLKRLDPGQREYATLVTGDRELGDAARLLGVSVETPERFQSRIAGPSAAPRDRGLSKAEVAEWEQYFDRPREER